LAGEPVPCEMSMRPPHLIQKLVLSIVVVSFLASACSSGGSGTSSGPKQCAGGPGTTCIAALSAGAVQLSLIQAQSDVPTGSSFFTFGLTTQQGQLLSGGQPQVWIATDDTAMPMGPFTANFYEFTPDPTDKSPRSPLTGFYGVPIEMSSAGSWLFAAVADINGTREVGTQTVKVTSGPVPAAVGSKAVSVATPVATTPAKLKEIDTRVPPSPLHYISLDKALTNGKPTVVTFATPLLCESMLCGPVVDEVLLVFQKYGAQAANFIHVEEFPPGPDLKPDTSTLPSYWQKWGFVTEPWTIVIDKNGIIRARFEGPVTASIIEATLKRLL
jgi:hypothetical protein